MRSLQIVYTISRYLCFKLFVYTTTRMLETLWRWNFVFAPKKIGLVNLHAIVVTELKIYETTVYWQCHLVCKPQFLAIILKKFQWNQTKWGIFAVQLVCFYCIFFSFFNEAHHSFIMCVLSLFRLHIGVNSILLLYFFFVALSMCSFVWVFLILFLFQTFLFCAFSVVSIWAMDIIYYKHWSIGLNVRR